MGLRFATLGRAVGAGRRAAAGPGRGQLGAPGVGWALGAALQAAGIPVAPLQPANCGFDVGWSEHLASHHAGAPLKNVVLRCTGPAGQAFERKGECVITATGLEGNLVYAASALLRDQILRQGRAELTLDLRPDRSLDELRQALARGGAPARWPTTCASRRASRGGRGPAARGVSAEDWARLSKDAAWLAGRIKALPVTLSATRPLDEAISTAGGVRLDALDGQLRLRQAPRIALAGEMLDWEAPPAATCSPPVWPAGWWPRRACSRPWAGRPPRQPTLSRATRAISSSA
jgi:predicted flavoprotein YhiN